ncbi:MAG: glycosyltransferase [Pyrinomonadaceae bacterium]
MKKRVLQFTGSFNQGGSERQAITLAAMLKAQGEYEVFLATLSNDGPLLDDANIAGFRDIPEFPLTSFYNTNFVRQVRLCAKYLQDNKIDIVHTHDFYTNVFGMAAATLARVPERIASKRETLGMRSRAQEAIEKIAFGRAHAVVVNSSAVREHLLERGIGNGKLRLIYNGLDLDRFAMEHDAAAIHSQFAIPTEVRVVTLVANLRHAVKNVPMLIRSAARIVSNHPDAHFVIAGEGGLDSELKELAVKAGVINNTHFIGRCTDVPALLAASDVCVLTSTAEGFSNSILEYMAAGKPVVATNVGGASEAIIDGQTGYLVASDDDVAMAECVLELIGDREKAAGFGIQGRNVIWEQFSREKQLASIIELYDSVWSH